MKVCPECQARFDGGEVFCPHDGTELVDARELSPGEMTGLDLGEAIHLERLAFADALGERYHARLKDGGQSLRVTIFNRGHVPDESRRTLLQRAIAGLDGPLPAELLSLHSLRLDARPAFVAEEAARGPSLASVLEERSALPWQMALRLTCSIGRAAQYLADHDLIHRALHPQAVFVTDLHEGRIQLGEWATGLLASRDRPLDIADENEQAYVGYSAYMAPEVIRDGTDADQRSVVYALGMLLYEMVAGKPPFTSKTTTDTLKRQLHEKPLKLSIARGGAAIHPELDDVLDMMWFKDPERRFHTPKAAVSALSSLLDAPLDEIAPELQAADESVFGDSATGADQAQDATDSTSKKTAAGMPAVSVVGDVSIEEDSVTEIKAEEPAPDEEEQASIIIDDPELRSAIEQDESDEDETDDETEQSDSSKDEQDETNQREDASDDEVDEARQTEPSDEAEPKTLMMGSVSDVEDKADQEDSDEAEPDQADDEPDDDDASAADEAEEADEAVETDEADEAEEADEADTQADIAANDGAKKTLLMGSVDDLEDEGSTDKEADQADEVDDAEAVQDNEDDAETDEDGEADQADEDVEADQADEDVEADQADEDVEADQADEDVEADQADEDVDASSDKMEVGFVDVANDGGGEFGEDWFSRDATQTWEHEQVSVHHERSENRLKYATAAVAILLVLGAVALFVYVETYEESDEQHVEAVEEEEDSGADTEALRADFEAAVERGHLIPPFDRSALNFLKKLKRHADGEDVYEEARATFVAEATKRAREVEASNLRQAHDLAGYANQFAPDDQELQAYFDDLQARLPGQSQADDEPDAGAQAASDAGTDTSDAQEELAKDDQGSAAGADNAQGSSTSSGGRADRGASSSSGSSASSQASSSQKSAGRSLSKILAEAKAAKSSGNTSAAINLYREAVRKSPSSHQAHAALGTILFDQASYAQALVHNKKAASLRPTSAQYSLRLGMTHFKLGDFRAAHSAWSNVLDHDPDNAVAKRYLQLVEDKL